MEDVVNDKRKTSLGSEGTRDERACITIGRLTWNSLNVYRQLVELTNAPLRKMKGS